MTIKPVWTAAASCSFEGQSTPSSLILLSLPPPLHPSPIPPARNSCGVTAARPPSQDLGVDYRGEWGRECGVRIYAAPPPSFKPQHIKLIERCNISLNLNGLIKHKRCPNMLLSSSCLQRSLCISPRAFRPVSEQLSDIVQFWGICVNVCVVTVCGVIRLPQLCVRALMLCPALTQARLICEPELHNEVLLFSKAGCRKS